MPDDVSRKAREIAPRSGVVETPIYRAYCEDGCGGIITEGWSSRPFADRASAERALRDHQKECHG